LNIADNKCEVCVDINKTDKNYPVRNSKVGMNDKQMNLHYACLVHIDELWAKLDKP
jgi:hypothetical protein